MTSVKDIATRNAITTSPDMPLLKAANILVKHNFHGLPVVDKDNVVVGIFTEYDLISVMGEEGSAIHLPTLQTLLQNLHIFGKDKSEFQKEIDAISRVTVGDVMNKEPLTLNENATFDEIIKAFREHHRVNPIPVIDSQKKLVGVVSRFDVVKLFDLLK